MRPPVSVLSALTGSLILTLPALAGPLPPCIGATLSANQQVLVTNEISVSDPHSGKPQTVIGSVFTILRKLNNPNAGTRITGPDAYWTINPIWSVRLPSNQTAEIITCPYVLVTNDGEFLILVINRPGGDNSALHIYRRRERGHLLAEPDTDSGILVKAISVDAIIPPPPSVLARTITDHTPQWYANGAFTFSQDNRTLVFRDPTIGTVTIDLPTGTVARHSVR